MRRWLPVVVTTCALVAGTVACDDDDGSETQPASTTTGTDSRPPLVATSVPATPTPTPAPAADDCGAFPEWLGPATSAVIRRTEGSASCDEVYGVARDFFLNPAVPRAASVRGWECSRDAEGVEHVGDCSGPTGHLTVDVVRPGEG